MTRRVIQYALFTIAMAAAAEHPVLSGVWQLDVAASTLGNMPAPKSAILTISDDSHKKVHIMMVTEGTQVERTIDSEWRVDDQYHPVEGSGGEVLARWEGPVLVGKKVTDSGLEETVFRLGPASDTLIETIQSAGNVTTLRWRRK